jgi:hypothetical protein
MKTQKRGMHSAAQHWQRPGINLSLSFNVYRNIRSQPAQLSKAQAIIKGNIDTAHLSPSPLI